MDSYTDRIRHTSCSLFHFAPESQCLCTGTNTLFPLHLSSRTLRGNIFGNEPGNHSAHTDNRSSSPIVHKAEPQLRRPLAQPVPPKPITAQCDSFDDLFP